MSPEEYKTRMRDLQAQIEELAAEFYGGLVAEFEARTKNGKPPKLSAFAVEFGIPQSNMSRRLTAWRAAQPNTLNG